MIKTIIEAISGAINSVIPPLAPLPATMILEGTQRRTGLKSSTIANKIIARKYEAGIASPDDANIDVSNLMEIIRIEEIVSALQSDAKIEIAISPEAIMVQTTGANSGGPVVSTGIALKPCYGSGIIR